MTVNLLYAILFLPLVAALVLQLLRVWPQIPAQVYKIIALGTVGACLLMTIVIVWECLSLGDQPARDLLSEVGVFETTVSKIPWIVTESGGEVSSFNIQFELGLDGLSLWLFALGPFLTFVSILIGWNQIRERVPTYYSWVLLLLTGMTGAFAARDVILFYAFFELTLVPLFFLVGMWGGEDRKIAAFKLFIYTFTGSVLTFLGLIGIVAWNYQTNSTLTFSIQELAAAASTTQMDPTLQFYLFFALFAGFAVKTPLFPFHTWLPQAYSQAPTPVSMLLAGVLAKMGTYGFARFTLTMLPEASQMWLPYMMLLATIGIVYGGLIALAQTDMKRLVAYSSFSHLGFVMLGLFALNDAGLQGSVLLMVAHGLSVAGMFAMVAIIQQRYDTTEIIRVGGLANKYPVMCVMMMFFTLASVGLPLLSNFPGELLVLMGAFQQGFAATEQVLLTQRSAIFAILGIILGAWYMLVLIARLFFGTLREPPVKDSPEYPASDLLPRELFALVPLAAVMLWMGLFPQTFLGSMKLTLDDIATRATEKPNAATVSRTASLTSIPTKLGDLNRVD